ncbi:hypothetical protein CU098_006177 [Rhizopus stolonifer]|uniref:Uncharacterized protein n=1 Tax=Rhizopus stolonifer TaxID=4846 RepID=A0A367J0Q4_RHIST|nr:hypothetical protein CU098_006177 [Rhizopus stolonifer]
MIGIIQDDIARVNALKADKFWREHSERPSGLLKRLSTECSMKRVIPALYDPAKQQMVTSNEDKMSTMAEFYDQLYTPDPMDQDALDQLLSSLRNIRISKE